MKPPMTIDNQEAIKLVFLFQNESRENGKCYNIVGDIHGPIHGTTWKSHNKLW